jgi:CheY-like chemotaxis protein
MNAPEPRPRTLPTAVYIEDDPLCADLVATALRERFRILPAPDGLTGLDLIERAAPDLVLVDLLLPGLSGFEVIERLRSLPQTAHLPVLVISARIMAGEIARAQALGCGGFIVKPFNIELLRRECLAALPQSAK